MTKTIRAAYDHGHLWLHDPSDLVSSFGVVIPPNAQIELTISEIRILPSQTDHQNRQAVEQRSGSTHRRLRLTESNPAWSWLIGLGVLAVLLTIGYLDYTAYTERFPGVAPWTYFFQRGCN